MATIVAKFVRHLSADDLRLYFGFRHIDATDLDWRTADGLLRKAAIKQIEEQLESNRTQILVDAEAIIGLADEAGHRAMQDVAKDR